MFSRFKIVLPLLVLGAAFGATLPSASARKKPKPTPTPVATATLAPRLKPFEEGEKEAIYEAVLIWSLKGRKLGPENPVYVAFVGQDPTDEFIERMRKDGIRVVGMSKSPQPFASGDRGEANHRNPHFTFGPIQKLDGTHVTVYWDFMFGGDTLTLQLKDKIWEVTKDEPKWID